MFKQLTIINGTVLEEETQLLAHPVRAFLICGNLVLAIGVFTFFSLQIPFPCDSLCPILPHLIALQLGTVIFLECCFGCRNRACQHQG